jgi:hypothetical protein
VRVHPELVTACAKLLAVNEPSRPPRAVLAEFGLSGPPVALAGGRGTSRRAGRAVVKPLDMDPEAMDWQASLLRRLDGRSDFRVSVPLPAASSGTSRNISCELSSTASSPTTSRDHAVGVGDPTPATHTCQQWTIELAFRA